LSTTSTWSPEKEGTILVSPTSLLQSLSIGKEFKASPPRQTETPELKQKQIAKSSDDGYSEIASPVKLTDYSTPGTKLKHDQPNTGIKLNLDHSNPSNHEDTTMIHPIPITPDSTTRTPNLSAASKNNPDNVLSPSRSTNGHGPRLRHNDHKSGNRWFNLRNKTATKLRAAVERSQKAEILGVDRTRKEYIVQKREYNLKQLSSAASNHPSTGTLSSLPDFNDGPVTPYKPPMSSCDGDRSVGSLGSKELTFAGAIMSAARTVDRKRTVERNRAIEAAIAGRVAMADVAKVARRSSYTLHHGNIPFVDSDGETKGSLDSHQADEIPFSDVKRRMNGLRKDNQSLVVERDHLQKQLNKERQESLRTLKEARKEVEERNLKLAVLEEHFMSLNEHSTDDDINIIESAGLSFDSTDSTAKGGDCHHDDNISHQDDDNISHQQDDNISHQQDDNICHQHDDCVSHRSTSIIRLDKSYLTNLKKSYRETNIVLDKMRNENNERHQVKEEMMRQLEDLSERLRCRETTICSLDQSLKQMRASRFKRKPTLKRTHKAHRRRNSLTDGLPIPLIDETETEESSTVSINTSNNNQFDEATIAEAVNNALDIKGKEHAIEIKVLQDKLELKATLVKKLKLKNGSMKRMNSSKRSLSCISLGDPSSESSMMRNINMTNEIMNTLTFRLEAMLTRIDQSTQPAEGIYDIGVDIPDELAPIRKLGSKISLVNDEMKISMQLIKQRMKNEIESIKNGFNTQSTYAAMERPKSAGQATSSGDNCSTNSMMNNARTSDRLVQKEVIDAVQARMAKMIHDVETNIGKDIKDVRYQIQDMEVVMGSKQDMVEALELACSEHDRNFRSLQEQMAAMVLRLEERADQEPG